MIMRRGIKEAESASQSAFSLCSMDGCTRRWGRVGVRVEPLPKVVRLGSQRLGVLW